ncbi:sigma-70 family RNA polymerase sigma factor [Echinicola soli]|uniref:Sigma-70 family RNA polymerase sigma factor n=2 Tax=Echinicola soli TaxID=2591634 RepID=A0A514CP54_9BACT|nr:sigma-70 family RNA polymerase sigma factor [Echinicola soli]
MTAVLCRHFGLKHIEIAEDIVSDAFLKASEIWALEGVPENPRAWLYKVAKNKTKDYFKHLYVFEEKVKTDLPKTMMAETQVAFDEENIRDSQLAMIFVVCSPINAQESQISLALQILCGFSVEEIANAFLSKRETIKKRLLRARKNLRKANFDIQLLSDNAIQERLSPVLRTIYLLFNEGYSSNHPEHPIRKELCSEAMRLAVVLTENDITNLPVTNALLALMCFQASRLEARQEENGEVILFEEQDKSKWDQSLIQRGNYFLIEACKGEQLSKYHLEAAIAYWHSAAVGEEKWPHILQRYNQLILIEYSPITAMNRVFAYSKVYGAKSALMEAEKLDLADNSHYHALMGYLFANEIPEKAVAYYTSAIQLSNSKSEKLTLQKQLDRMKSKKQ